MHSTRAALVTCALFFGGCAAGVDQPAAELPGDEGPEAPPEDQAPQSPAPAPSDCADQEGPCVQDGAVTTPEVPEKMEAEAPPATPTAPVTNALPSRYPFWVLQLNLCNSGVAGCYEGGRSIPEGATAIRNAAPDVVTLNEICSGDIAPLQAALAAAYPGGTIVSGFKAAGDRRTNAPYKCKNGQDYGIGIIAHIPGTYAGHQVHSGLYASQDTGSAEQRAWLCIAATGTYYACTTHLTSTSGSIAMNQCKDLMNNILPSIRSAGGAAPAVVGGDLNLKFKGSPNAQDCVPGGTYRKGDGDVQHIMATTDLAFSSSRKINLNNTDHDGWFVAMTAP
jgi:hypothetical protein